MIFCPRYVMLSKRERGIEYMNYETVNFSLFLKGNKLNFILGILFSVLKVIINIYFAFLMERVMNFALSDSLSSFSNILIISLLTLML